MKLQVTWKQLCAVLFALTVLAFVVEMYNLEVYISFWQTSITFVRTTLWSCGHSDHPKTKIVFLKTYKTASTTVSSILMRFGYYHNLSFLIPMRQPVFSRVTRFRREMLNDAVPPLKASNGSYDVLAIHVPFNKKELALVIPNATYITIIRNPVSQFESTFGQYSMGTRIVELAKDTGGRLDPLRVFLSNPHHYYRHNSPYTDSLLRNRQIFDIGLERDDFDNATKIDQVIMRAEEDFDLVMIAEYFDESLVLLKRLLCWEFEDVAYILQNSRPSFLRFQLDDWKRKRILQWNAADDKLYRHFNATFWRKVEEYGPEFQNDLAEFRRLLDRMWSDCLDRGRYAITYKNRRNDTMLREDAPSYCSVMSWDGNVGTQVLRKRQLKNDLSSSLPKFRLQAQ
ncbi:galactosylceramide sulfotransferase-like isoform X2 [Ptychodera flava]|uniref:galactosylceramide sulfotransferase-like isoform X2 n=1 Tax=Ptychodera flava TaxID=63121 RepID=UPI00396A3080